MVQVEHEKHGFTVLPRHTLHDSKYRQHESSNPFTCRSYLYCPLVQFELPPPSWLQMASFSEKLLITWNKWKPHTRK